MHLHPFLRLQSIFDPAGMNFRPGEFRAPQQAGVERHRGGDAGDVEPRQRRGAVSIAVARSRPLTISLPSIEL